jgi:hypothetical protein
VRLVPEAATCGGQLLALLADPEMMALAAASPRMAGILRSLCRMLGLDPGACLPPLPRLRRLPRQAAPPAPAGPGPVAGPGPALSRPPCALFLRPPAASPGPKRRRTARRERSPWVLDW